MISDQHPDSDRLVADGAFVTAGALSGAGHALLATSVVGGSALLLERLWPWLAWGYVVLALALGISLSIGASRLLKVQEREVAQVRRRYRSG
jgi:hypothetical protein